MRNFSKTDSRWLLELIYQVRSSQGIKQSDLAKLMDVPQSLISKIENGERKIDIITYLQLCECLNVDPHEMLKKFTEKIYESKSNLPKSK